MARGTGRRPWDGPAPIGRGGRSSRAVRLAATAARADVAGQVPGLGQPALPGRADGDQQRPGAADQHPPRHRVPDVRRRQPQHQQRADRRAQGERRGPAAAGRRPAPAPGSPGRAAAAAGPVGLGQHPQQARHQRPATSPGASAVMRARRRVAAQVHARRPPAAPAADGQRVGLRGVDAQVPQPHPAGRAPAAPAGPGQRPPVRPQQRHQRHQRPRPTVRYTAVHGGLVPAGREQHPGQRQRHADAAAPTSSPVRPRRRGGGPPARPGRTAPRAPARRSTSSPASATQVGSTSGDRAPGPRPRRRASAASTAPATAASRRAGPQVHQQRSSASTADQASRGQRASACSGDREAARRGSGRDRQGQDVARSASHQAVHRPRPAAVRRRPATPAPGRAPGRRPAGRPAAPPRPGPGSAPAQRRSAASVAAASGAAVPSRTSHAEREQPGRPAVAVAVEPGSRSPACPDQTGSAASASRPTAVAGEHGSHQRGPRPATTWVSEPVSPHGRGSSTASRHRRPRAARAATRVAGVGPRCRASEQGHGQQQLRRRRARRPGRHRQAPGQAGSRDHRGRGQQRPDLAAAPERAPAVGVRRACGPARSRSGTARPCAATRPAPSGGLASRSRWAATVTPAATAYREHQDGGGRAARWRCPGRGRPAPRRGPTTTSAPVRPADRRTPGPASGRRRRSRPAPRRRAAAGPDVARSPNQPAWSAPSRSRVSSP